MPQRVQMRLYKLGVGKPTLSEEHNVGSPHAKRDRHNDPILVPNGNSKGDYEFRKYCHRRKRTFEERSRAKIKRGLGKLRPGDKGGKWGLELHPRRLQ